jgi:uncharacterized protein
MEDEKLVLLRERLKSLGRIVVAFSGGTDSSFLMKVASEVLGTDAVAVTACLDSFPEREFLRAKNFCEKENIIHHALKVDVFSIQGFAENPKNRCYVCKRGIFSRLKEFASENGIRYVCDGTNADDEKDYRPGVKALSELGILSPLRDLGFTKNEIRLYLHDMNPELSITPSSPCLASRIPYDEKITREKLDMIQHAENFLYDRGFTDCRVRFHTMPRGNIARIEILPGEGEKALFFRNEICDKFESLGFNYVSLDLRGFRSGSLNEVLNECERGE